MFLNDKDRTSSVASVARSEATTELLSTATSSSGQDSGCEETPTNIAVSTLCIHRPMTESTQTLQDTADRLVGVLQRRIGDHLPSCLLKNVWQAPLKVQIGALQAAIDFAQSDLVRPLEEEERKAKVVAKLEHEVTSRLLASQSVDNVKASKAQKDNAVTRARKAVAARMCGERAAGTHPSSHCINDFPSDEMDDFYGALPLDGMREFSDSDMIEFRNSDFADPNMGYFMNYMYGDQSSAQLPASELSPNEAEAATPAEASNLQWKEDGSSMLSASANPWWPSRGEETGEAWSDIQDPASYMVNGWYPAQEYLEDGVESMQDFFALEHSEAGTPWNFQDALQQGMKGYSKRHWRQAKEKDFREQFCSEGCKREITTLMIRNVPNACTTAFLMEALDSLGFQSKYDFIYVPMDNGSLRSIGYAFVNFMSPEVAQSCIDKLRNNSILCQRCSQYRKPAWVTPAHLQGLRDNLEHYKRTKVNFDIVEAGQQMSNCYRPIVIKGLPDSLADTIVGELAAEMRQLMDESGYKPSDQVAWSDSCSTVLEAITSASDAATSSDVGGSSLERATSNFLRQCRTPSRTPSPSPERYALQPFGHPGSLPEQLPVKRTFIHYESKEEPAIADARGDGVKHLCRSSSDPCVLLQGDGFQAKPSQASYPEGSDTDLPLSKELQESSTDTGKPKSVKSYRQERLYERSAWRSGRNGYGGYKAKWLPKDRSRH